MFVTSFVIATAKDNNIINLKKEKNMYLTK